MEPIPDLFWQPASPKFGAAPAAAGGFEEGMTSSLVVTAGRAAVYWLDDLDSKEPPVTKEQYDKEFAIPGGPKWVEGMSPVRARRMFENTINDRLSASLTTGHSTSALVGNLAGGMAADLPLNFLPPARIVGVERQMMTAGQRFAGRAANAVATGAYQGTLQVGGLAALSPYAGKEYTMEQAAMDLAGSAIISTAFGIGEGTFAQVNKSWKDTVSDAYFTRATQGDAPDGVFAAAMRAQDPGAQAAAELAAKAKASVKTGQVDTQSIIGDSLGKRDVGFIGEDIAMARSPLTAHQLDYTDRLRTQKTASADTLQGPGLRGLERKVLERQLRINAEFDAGTAHQARRKIVRDNSYVARSDDEAFMADMWKRMFGVDVQFFDEATSTRAGVYGLIHASDPTKVFIRSGVLHGAPDSMVTVAGHELGHSIRLRDTSLWTNMTEAILDAHNGPSRDPLIGEAYRQVVAQLDSPDKISPWHGLSKAAKVDEVMATVLGRAMESKDFWTSLYNRTPRGAESLRIKLLTAARKVAGVKNPKSKTLAAGLGKQLAAAEEGGAHIRDIKDVSNYWKSGPLTTDQRLEQFYRGRGMAMLDDLRTADDYASWAAMVGKAEQGQATLMEFDAMLSDMAQLTSEMSDRSGTPVNIGPYDTVIKNRAIRTDPRLWVINNVFGKAKDGTPEKTIFNKWKAKAFKGDFLGEAMKESPLVKITDHGDGTYDIHVIRDDEFPKWWENRQGVDYSNDFVAAFTEESKAIEASLRKLAVEVQMNRGATDEKLAKFSADFDEAGGHGGLLAEFGNTPEAAEALRVSSLMFDETVPSAESKAMARQAFLIAYRDFIAKKMDTFRMDVDKANYANVYDRYREIDLLAKFQEDEPGAKVDLGPKESHQEVLARTAKALDEAWSTVVKKGLEAEDGSVRKVSDYTLANGDAADGKTAQDIQGIRKLVREDVEKLLLSYNDAWFDLHGDDIVSADTLKATIDVLTDLQMDRTVPNWRKLDAIKKTVDHELTESLDLLKETGELDSEHKPVKSTWSDPDSEDPLFMARRPDETDEQLAARGNAKMQQEAAKGRLSMKQAAALDQERLKRDHTTYAKFLTDYAPATTSLIQKELQGLGLSTESADGKPLPPKKLEGDLLELQSAIDRHDTFFAVNNMAVDRFVNGELDPIARKIDADIMALAEREMRYTGSAEKAILAMREGFLREANSKKLGEILAHKARTVLNNKAKVSLDTLYSYLDGLQRKDVQASGASVNATRAALRDADISPFVNFLDYLGVKTAWEDNSLIAALEAEHKGQGKGDPIVKRLATILQTTRDMQAGRLNSLGANIRNMERGELWSAVHNAQRMKVVDEGTYARNVAQMLDLVETERLHGHNATRPDGSTYFDAELFLKQFHHEAIDPRKVALDGEFDPNTDGGNLANQVSRSKTMIFKPGEAHRYDMQYGSGDTASLIIAQIGRRSEVAAFMQHFGPDYKATWSRFMAESGGDSRYSLDKRSRIDQTFKMLTGELDHPVDQGISVMGKAARNFSNSVVAWMSGVSSITDMGNAASALRHVSGDTSYADMVGALKTSIKNQMANGGEHKAFFQGTGVGLRSVVGAYARLENPIGGRLGQIAGTAQRLSDLTFKWSGLEASGRAQQNAFMDVLTRIIGDQAQRSKQSPEFVNWLSTYNITPEQFKRMSAHAKEIEGLEGIRLSADMITDGNDAMALRVAMRDSMDYAVLQPSISTEALLRFGTKAGTPLGEAVRCVGHFKGYPIDMVRRITRRFDNGYGESFWSWNGSVNRAQKEKLIWASTMIGLAAVAISMKDMMRGREPMNPFDTDQWNMGNLTRVVAQAGVGPFAAIEQYMSPRQLAGPTLGIAGNLAAAGYGAVTGEPNAAYNLANATAGALPGASIAPLAEIRKAVLGSIMPETMGAPYQRMLTFREMETGQSSLYSNSSSN
jgi:hypothetical protein